MRYNQYLSEVEALNNAKEELRIKKDKMTPHEKQEAAAEIMNKE